jgi:hypothetical protein
MQYRLRTLVILTAVGPPLLASIWLLPSLILVLLAAFIIGLCSAVACDASPRF